MHSKQPGPTKAESDRIERLKILGCLPCWIVKFASNPADAHHVVEGGRRVGHHAVFALCKYHHQGYPWSGYSDAQMAAILGPSWAHSTRAFTAAFGTQAELVELQTALLAAPPGGEYQLVLRYKRFLVRADGGSSLATPRP